MRIAHKRKSALAGGKAVHSCQNVVKNKRACFPDSLPGGTHLPDAACTVEAIEECTRSLRPVPHRVVRRGCYVEGWIFTCLFHRFVAIPPAQLHTFLHNDDRRSIAPRSAQHPHNENLKGSGGASTAPNGGLREPRRRNRAEEACRLHEDTVGGASACIRVLT